MKILVTGGAGFIGSAVIKQLLNDSLATVINLISCPMRKIWTYEMKLGDRPRYYFERADVKDFATGVGFKLKLTMGEGMQRFAVCYREFYRIKCLTDRDAFATHC